jgi:hypothetical protein
MKKLLAAFMSIIIIINYSSVVCGQKFMKRN